MNVYSLPSVFRYEWVSFDKTIDYPSLGKIRFVLYGAENHLGLIGSERNGIAILSEHHATVLCDRICNVDTGSLGAQPEQIQEFERLCMLGEAELIEFLNQHDRSRFTIDAQDFKQMKV